MMIRALLRKQLRELGAAFLRSSKTGKARSRASAVGYALFCRVDVTDTGPGLPESAQARLFQRFYRSPSASEAAGVGIGLYLARQIAAGQGGYLKVSSRPGEGSTFSLFLPRAEERT